MSIPLDRLYDHLHNKSNHDIIIYRWLPHGSKKLEDLCELHNRFRSDWVKSMTTPIAIMHDQEPLCYNYWSNNDFIDNWKSIVKKYSLHPDYLGDDFLKHQTDMHLRSIVGPGSNLYDKLLLVHSEQNSDQLKMYEQQNYVPVYYWSHAVIAADWFRYAEQDPVLEHNIDSIKTDFLIYNRAWSGTREYRLYFAELLVKHNLIDHCLTTFSPIDNGQHYTNHVFKNLNLSISCSDLETIFKPNIHQSSASADYNNTDYALTGIEVVLETLVDDTRWHLTEKTLRPIACGKPFMLASTPGALQYLRNYGFETFGEFINEEYDTVESPQHRLTLIIQEMKRIANMSLIDKKNLWAQLHKIAERNKRLFFSPAWQQKIQDEFYQNLNAGIKIINQHRTGKIWKKFLNSPTISGSTGRPPEQIQQLISWLKGHQ